MPSDVSSTPRRFVARGARDAIRYRRQRAVSPTSGSCSPRSKRCSPRTARRRARPLRVVVPSNALRLNLGAELVRRAGRSLLGARPPRSGGQRSPSPCRGCGARADPVRSSRCFTRQASERLPLLATVERLPGVPLVLEVAHQERRVESNRALWEPLPILEERRLHAPNGKRLDVPPVGPQLEAVQPAALRGRRVAERSGLEDRRRYGGGRSASAGYGPSRPPSARCAPDTPPPSGAQGISRSSAGGAGRLRRASPRR